MQRELRAYATVCSVGIELMKLREYAGKVASVCNLIELMKKGNPSIAQNASIATARLAQDPQNLQVIRDLRGIEIMGAVGKHGKR